jgi:hypothetical protein
MQFMVANSCRWQHHSHLSCIKKKKISDLRFIFSKLHVTKERGNKCEEGVELQVQKMSIVGNRGEVVSMEQRW